MSLRRIIRLLNAAPFVVACAAWCWWRAVLCLIISLKFCFVLWRLLKNFWIMHFLQNFKEDKLLFGNNFWLICFYLMKCIIFSLIFLTYLARKLKNSHMTPVQQADLIPLILQGAHQFGIMIFKLHFPRLEHFQLVFELNEFAAFCCLVSESVYFLFWENFISRKNLEILFQVEESLSF
jgi:hypothetical protein